MYDAMLSFLPRVDETAILAQLGVAAGEYVLATVHRASNTDDAASLTAVIDCLALSQWPVLLPGHPRMVAALQKWGVSLPAGVRLIEPVSYLAMLALEKNARFIMTDSGGVQKEAYLLGVPCITLREETEWVETSVAGWNTIARTNQQMVASALAAERPSISPPTVFGDGTAATQISRLLADS
jgi:UDP-N-acetylglucosamine 2-epimerase